MKVVFLLLHPNKQQINNHTTDPATIIIHQCSCSNDTVSSIDDDDDDVNNQKNPRPLPNRVPNLHLHLRLLHRTRRILNRLHRRRRRRRRQPIHQRPHPLHLLLRLRLFPSPRRLGSSENRGQNRPFTLLPLMVIDLRIAPSRSESSFPSNPRSLTRRRSARVHIPFDPHRPRTVGPASRTLQIRFANHFWNVPWCCAGNASSS